MITQFTAQQKKCYKGKVFDTIAALTFTLNGCLPKETPPQQRLNEGLERAKKEILTFNKGVSVPRDTERLRDVLSNLNDGVNGRIKRGENAGNLVGALADLKKLQASQTIFLKTLCTTPEPTYKKDTLCLPSTTNGLTVGESLGISIERLESSIKVQEAKLAKEAAVEKVFGK